MATKRRSLRVELIATLAIVLVMAVVTLSLLTELLGHRRHRIQERERIAEHARGLAIVASPLLGGGVTVETAALEQVLRPSVGSIGIVGIEVFRLTNSGSQSLLRLGLTDELVAPQATIDSGSSIEATEDGRVVVDEPIRTFGRRAMIQGMVLRVVARPTPWTTKGDWQDTLVLASGVGLLLLVLGGLLVEIQVLRPLREVRRAASQVALGDLDARAPDDGPAEFQSLAADFNHMTDALRQKLHEIATQREQLTRAEQMAGVGRIAAGVAHEVGNPLAAILGYVELLLDPRTAVSNEDREILERTRDQITRIQGIVGQLLDYSQPSRTALQPVDLEAAATGLVALLKHDPKAKDVALSVQGHCGRARADPGRLEQVLQNLIVNACRAAHEGDGDPRVQVRLGESNGEVWIEVQDSGPGVPTDVRPRLFEPFFTTSAAGEGTGLGLAISQGLVESMNGTIACLPVDARPALGSGASPGATFRVTLPAAGSEKSDNVLPSGGSNGPKAGDLGQTNAGPTDAV